ncbi:MAG: GGDEF domain-containing protein [Candidatus Izemoplasma sp.]
MDNNISLEKFAYIDDLTGLKNKHSLIRDCESKKLEDIHFICIDLWNFKKINQIMGYNAGDDILQNISEKLINFCGKSEVYRISGDTFILLTENEFLCDPSVLDKLFNSPFKHSDVQFMINARVAVLDYGEFESSSIKEVLMLFDYALADAKAKKINGVIEVHKNIQEAFLEKREIEKHFFDGVQRDKFFPKFHPFIDTFTNEVVGFETVSRWVFYDKTIRPVQFLPIAIYTGLIFDIECKMFRETCKLLSELKNNKQFKLSKGFKAALNFTIQTLSRIEINDLLKVLNKYKLSAKEIIIELHEEFIEEDNSTEKIRELRDAGFYIVLDSYSTKNSSLCYLADAGVNAIKLDKALLERIDQDPEYRRMHSVYSFMTELANKIDIRVISDGISSVSNIDMVKDLGINIGIGPYYSKPIMKEEFIEKFFVNWKN